MEGKTGIKTSISVYAVTPFEPVRLGLRDSLAAAAPDIQWAGDADSLLEMVDDDRFQEADVILVDATNFNGANASSAYSMLVDRLPMLRVLFIGSPMEAQAISAGTLVWAGRLQSVGFLYRDGTISRVAEGLRLVASGVFVCEGDVMRRLMAAITQGLSQAAVTSRRFEEQLSGREQEVLGLVSDGLSNREIAARLYLSEGTVKAHVSHIMAKLGADRRTELVRLALSSGNGRAA